MPLNAPDYIRALVPYVPGKPIEETQREFNIRRVIKLASNENPLGPSPKAMAAIRGGLADLHRYPDASAHHLKAALAKHLHKTPAEIIVGNGSNEIIDMLIRTYCVAGDSIVTSKAAFIAYRICAQIHGVGTIEAHLDENLRSDLSEMAQFARDYTQVRMIFVANPNNPTGTYNTTAELKSFLKDVAKIRNGSVMVVLDYAYWEYVTAKDLPDPMKLLKEFPNVVVLRTFSKVYGLAGLRAGYGVARPEIIATVEKIRQPFNMNAMALMAATAALGDKAFVEKSVKVNNIGMKFWEKSLDGMAIPYWKSQGNFLLIDVSRGLGKRGGDVYLSCLKRGVIFRPVANYGLMHALRISVGTQEENKIAVKALEAEIPPAVRGTVSTRKKLKGNR